MCEVAEGVVLYSGEVVVNLHLATAQWHLVAHSGCQAVIVIVLGSLDTEVMVAHIEHWVAEGIGLGGSVIDGHTDCAALLSTFLVGLAAYAWQFLVLGCCLTDGHRRLASVDARIDGSVRALGIAVNLAGSEAVGEVYYLRHLALLEERGVAAGRHFYHLVAGGEQVGNVLTGLLVGLYHQAVALYGHTVEVASTCRFMLECVALDNIGSIQRVFYHPCTLVALELQHYAEVVAKVVL